MHNTMEFDFLKTGQWLSLTEQQFQILAAIHKLELRNEKTSPQDIVREYRKISDKLIQKPNLFTIIKTLSEKKLVKKTGQAAYSINFEGIRDTLTHARAGKQEELRQLTAALQETEEYFRTYLKPREQPRVEYLDNQALYAKLSEEILNSTTFSIVANFPSIAYTYTIHSRLGREKYVQNMLEKTVKKQELRLCYLTDLDVDYLFNHAFMALGDPSKAYTESMLVLDQLASLIQSTPKIDVRFHEDPHGLDFAIPEKKMDEPESFIVFTRDEHRNIMGGVHVKASEPAKQAKQVFNRLFSYAEKLDDKSAGKKIQEIKQKLQEKYRVLGE